MIKATSSKDTRDYLFTSLVLPMKKLSVRIEVETPFIDENNAKYEVRWELEPVPEHGNRNYQRRRARRSRKFVLVIEGNGKQTPFGYYEKKSHWVRLYPQALADMKAEYLIGRVEQQLNENTPFTRVIIDTSDGYKGLRVDNEGLRALRFNDTY